MKIPIFLAMTARELRECSSPPEHMAWMACHFSPYAAGLTDFPDTLPPESLLILDDRIPISGHNPDFITDQLNDAVERLKCRALLLDLQRKNEPQSAVLVKKICSKLSCPVAVSEAYAGGVDCGVFLSPPPPHLPFRQVLSPWQGRELWLDATCSAVCLTVTENGCIKTVPTSPPTQGLHRDEHLCCHYSISVQPEEICFTVFRTKADLSDLICQMGVTHAVGLYQEFGVIPEP